MNDNGKRQFYFSRLLFLKLRVLRTVSIIGKKVLIDKRPSTSNILSIMKMVISINNISKGSKNSEYAIAFNGIAFNGILMIT